MVTMYGIWVTGIGYNDIGSSWVSPSSDFKGLRTGNKDIHVINQNILDDMDSDPSCLSFWFSRAKAERYYREALAVHHEVYPDMKLEIEVKPIKVSEYVATQLRTRGWSFTVERDFGNA